MAFCKVCGAQVQDGARFCESCGAPIEQPAPQPVPQPVQQEYQSQYTYTAPVYTEAQPAASNSKGTLILAIVGAVCSYWNIRFRQQRRNRLERRFRPGTLCDQMIRMWNEE